MRAQPARAQHLIGYFDVAQLIVNGCLECVASEGGAAIVELEHDIARARQNLREGAARPIVENPLYARTAVNIHDGGVTLGGIEMQWLE